MPVAKNMLVQSSDLLIVSVQTQGIVFSFVNAQELCIVIVPGYRVRTILVVLVRVRM